MGGPVVRRLLRLQSYIDAFRARVRLHDHPEDFYTDPAVLSDESADDSDDETDDPDGCRPGELPLADFEAFARRGARHDFASTCFVNELGARDFDRAYYWSSHVGRSAISPDVWSKMKAEHPVAQLVATDSSPLPLNPEQRNFYDVVVRQYADELALRNPSQLLLNVDGVAGSGKTLTLLKTCARLQELSAEAGLQNPVFRTALTGIAAFNILGKTLHSLLRLPVKGKKADLSLATLQSLQSLFRHCRFLVVDEKSMIDVKTLSLVDDRLGAIFPTTSNRPFGGLNVLLCGNFFQLPPVGGKPLYSMNN